MDEITRFSNKVTKEYETDTNLKLAFICRVCVLFFVIIVLLNLLHIFKINSVIYPVLLFAMVVMLLPTLFYNILKLDNRLIRYFVLTLIVIMSGVLYAFLSYHVIIMLVFPVVISCLYCEKKSVVYTMLLGLPVMLISHLIAFKLKIVPDEPLVTLKGTILYGVLPRTLEYLSISIMCMSMTGKIQSLIESLNQKNTELLHEQESIIISLSQMIESQSKETGMHVKRVSEYTKILCRGLGCDDETVWKVGQAAMMHDVGKIMIPHSILEKPGKLTDSEYSIIKKHTVYGKRMLENSPGEVMNLSATIAYEHHERYDGKGYAGIKGEETSIYSRCVSVADVFDALVSWRPYKQPWTPEEAKKEIIANSGTQFDPKVVREFVQNFDEFLEVFNKYPDSQESIDTSKYLE